MAYPDTDEPDPGSWFTGILVTAAAIKAHIIDLLNIVRLWGRGYLGSTSTSGAVTLTTAGVGVAGSATVTFTLGSQRRVKITTKARYGLGTSTSGRMTVQAAYNSGASVSMGSLVALGVQGHIFNSSGVTGLNGSSSEDGVGDVLLAAGTYTAYPLCVRQNGGSNSDVAASFYCLVEDLGAS